MTQNKTSSTTEDWSFADLKYSETSWGPHGYHRYPAKFIPQLVRRIVDEWSEEGDLVGDQFLGSATTGIETLRAGRRFWGSDVNPTALLISQAKCTPIEPGRLTKVWNEIIQNLSKAPQVGRRKLTEDEIKKIKTVNIAQATKEERFAYWFPEAYTRSLVYLLDAILMIEELDLRTFFLCGFSNILRRCSIWLSGSTKPQKDLAKALNDPKDEFRKQSLDMMRRNKLYWDDLSSNDLHQNVNEKFKLSLGDARDLPLASNSLDLLVTSPPYATCYEYIDLHQLTQLWFEKYSVQSYLTWKNQCIGSKNLSLREINHTDCIGSRTAQQTLENLESLSKGPIGSVASHEAKALKRYFQDMNGAIKEASRVVAHNKYLVLVVGDSYKRGLDIPTSMALCEMAEDAGLQLEKKITRKVAGRVLVSTRDRVSGRFSSDPNDRVAYPTEDILVFKKVVLNQ